MQTLKAASLLVGGFALNFFTFAAFLQLLISGSTVAFWLTLTAAVLFVIIFVMQVLFVSTLPSFPLLAALQGALPVLAFWQYLGTDAIYFLVGSALLLMIGLLSGATSGSSLLRGNVKVKAFSIAHRVVPKVLVGILLFMSLTLYMHYFYLGNFSNKVASSIFEHVLQTVTPIARIWFPDISVDMTVEDVVAHMSETQLRRSKIELLQRGINIDELDPQARQDMVTQIENQISGYIEQIAGPISTGETVKEYLYYAMTSYVSNLSETAQGLLGIGSVLILFLVLRGIAFLLYVPIEVLSFLVFKLFIMAGFGEIGFRDVRQEVIVV